MNKSQPNRSISQSAFTSYGIILLTILTALIHLGLSFQFAGGPDLIFLLNGLGYLALVAALYAPLPALAKYQSYIRWSLLAYTALTVILWFSFGASTAIAYIDKTVEIVLIALLWAENQSS